VIDERKNSMRRLDSMKIEPKVEENEFSKMSNEDRNKRVEEFIQKFNSKSDSKHQLLMTIKFRRSFSVRIKDYIPKKIGVLYIMYLFN
jgi:hypothetical protein